MAAAPFQRELSKQLNRSLKKARTTAQKAIFDTEKIRKLKAEVQKTDVEVNKAQAKVRKAQKELRKLPKLPKVILPFKRKGEKLTGFKSIVDQFRAKMIAGLGKPRGR